MNKCQNTALKEALDKFLKGFAYQEVEEAEVCESVEKTLDWGSRFEGLEQNKKKQECP
jgi:hypothetical protein